MATQTIKVTRAQTLIDLCIQVYGTTQLLFKFAGDNNITIDSTISIGDVLTYDDALGSLLVISKIQVDRLNIVNPVPGQGATVNFWTDGLGTTFTDGLFNGFTDL